MKDFRTKRRTQTSGARSATTTDKAPFQLTSGAEYEALFLTSDSQREPQSGRIYHFQPLCMSSSWPHSVPTARLRRGTRAVHILLEQQDFLGGGWRLAAESMQDSSETEVFSSLHNFRWQQAPSLSQDLRGTSQGRPSRFLIQKLNSCMYKMSVVTSVPWGWCEAINRHQASSPWVPNTMGPH